MTPHTLRAYAGPADLATMKALVRDLWRERGPNVQCLPADLDWRVGLYLDDPNREPELMLCEAEGGLVGFAWRLRGTVDIVVRTDADLAARDLVAWALDHASPVAVHALVGNAMLERALAAAGLAPSGDAYLVFARSLASLAAPTWPAGIRPAAMSEVGDVAARAALHRAAFESPRLTEARYRALAVGDGYDPSLDMVALAPDGALVAFVLGWFDRELGVGLLEPVGTHPDHRGQGLARSLIAETLLRLAARGAHTAYICAAASDPVTPSLYAALGFHRVATDVAHRRALAPSSPSA